ncbi:MAG: AAA family ATPase [Succinivibrio sp.]|nr:AAA family ATPase [Succinivibrio sp.]
MTELSKEGAGTEDFAKIILKGGYYVDKTDLLQEIFINDLSENLLFTRPRRFGKTLNQTMIYHFCRLNYQNPGDTSYQERLFLDKGRNFKVAGEDFAQLREEYMGQFPVIYLSFRGVEGQKFNTALDTLLREMIDQYEKFLFLKDSVKLTAESKAAFLSEYAFMKSAPDNLDKPAVFDRAVNLAGTFLPTLCSLLHQEYDRQVLVLIDEYDVPLQKAVVAKEPYYEQMLDIIRRLSVRTFKQNPDPWLLKGIVTGCLKLTHQSVFTDANNFRSIGMDNTRFARYFGFTGEETHKMLGDYEITEREDEVKFWYDGYRFGPESIYCPWSLKSYCSDHVKNKNIQAKCYWANTSGNDILSLYAQSCDREGIEGLQKLVNGESLTVNLREFSTYPTLKEGMSFEDFMTLLLHTGYVTYEGEPATEGEVRLKIPNREVHTAFINSFNKLFSKDNPAWANLAVELLDSLLHNEVDQARILINKLLGRYISFRNTGYESYYHGFMLGVLGLAASSRNIELMEEQESGDGYSDIILVDADHSTATVLELKSAKNTRADRLKASEDAASQIIEKNYAESLRHTNCKQILALGIGFGGKYCEIKSLGDLACENRH